MSQKWNHPIMQLWITIMIFQSSDYIFGWLKKFKNLSQKRVHFLSDTYAFLIIVNVSVIYDNYLVTFLISFVIYFTVK